MKHIIIFWGDREIGDYSDELIPRIGDMITFDTKAYGRVQRKIKDIIWFIPSRTVHIRLSKDNEIPER